LHGNAIERGFRYGWFRIRGQHRKKLGEILGSEVLATRDDIDFLFQRRVPGTNSRAKLGANGKLRGQVSDLFA
jgi:hypothetical protein